MNAPKSESAMRKIITGALRDAEAFAGAFDNEACWPGTPDVYYKFTRLSCSDTGWIELKRLDELPKRSDTPVRCPCFKPHQRIWHRQAHAAGVATFVLLLIDDLWLLFPGWWAANHLGNVPIAELRIAATAQWSGGFNLENIRPWL